MMDALAAWLAIRRASGVNATMKRLDELCTPEFDVYTVIRAGVADAGREVIATDGQVVLEHGTDSFLEIVRRAGPLLPAHEANLFCAFVPPQAWRVVADPDSGVLHLAADPITFTPPSIETLPDGTRVLQFWAFRFPPPTVAQWTVWCADSRLVWKSNP